MPYAPATQFDPRLITAMGDNFTKPIGQALQLGIENYAQVHKEGKAADALREAMYGPEDDQGNPQNPTPFGISDDQWKTMGSRDRAAAAQGWMQSTILQKAMAETQHLQYENLANEFASKVGASVAQQTNENPELKQSLTPQQQALLRAVGQAGPANRGAGPMISPLIRAMSEAKNSESNPDVTPRQIKMPDGTVLNWQPNTKNPAFPSPNQKVDAAAAAQQRLLQWKLENGMGNGAVTDQDRFKFATQSNLARIKAAQEAMNDPFVTANPDSLAGAKAELDAARQERADLLATHPALKGAAGKAATTGAVLPLPVLAGKVDASKMQKGKTYQTKHGPAVWDGQQFNLAE